MPSRTQTSSQGFPPLTKLLEYSPKTLASSPTAIYLAGTILPVFLLGLTKNAMGPWLALALLLAVGVYLVKIPAAWSRQGMLFVSCFAAWSLCLMSDLPAWAVMISYGVAVTCYHTLSQQAISWLGLSLAPLIFGSFVLSQSETPSSPLYSLIILSPPVVLSMTLLRARIAKANQNELGSQISYKNLIRVACHDISNPLTLILGSAQIAESGVFDKKPEKLKELWPKIVRATDSINRVLINLRAFEAIQEPSRLTIEPINIENFLQDLRILYLDMANARQVTMEYIDHVSSDDTFEGDQLILKQACFGCLLHNAIRFSEAGGTVTAETRLENDQLRFQVTNSGSMFSPETLQNLYKFDFVARPATQLGNKEGGFSLSVCRLVIERFGGSLRIDQTPSSPQGTTSVTLIIPQKAKLN
ncbi:sensor histidine kinase [Pseudobacteriovorax antillogorgiicola]|uniref:histidine kinase n=1 Tax=Pseudobacteriovorax antillogorgiicola TaxID=1513793 RepID=A0A1Y6BYG5_9BACT|nr:HAMP domain-containing sensor histidine kinase [Pseudobacteriovorax antillogorgiicola]TCS51287.1 histidine kinase/DNA gyrase B/HSP90-like ATPase [Pseudobacteriovorax antillogorgiicola]SMF36139.1 Histidine kinase-, DNA gyrase B-, and HSP90-like ATPase [Pseudobacteriovorax antillogorgiicola]